MYSHTPLIWTLRGPLKVSVLSGLNLEKMEGPSFPRDKSNYQTIRNNEVSVKQGLPVLA